MFIEAKSADLALEWGRQISERFIRDLYRTDDVSCWSGSYAHWIAEHPDDEIAPGAPFSIPRVRYGEHPAFPDTRDP